MVYPESGWLGGRGEEAIENANSQRGREGDDNGMN